MRKIVFFAILMIGFTACNKRTQLPDVSKYIYSIPQVNLTQNAKVGAYYSQYKTTDWAKGYADTPLLGQYNPLTATVVDQQIAWADSGGVDFFVFKWDGTSYNSMLTLFQKESSNGNIKMVIDYNTTHLKATNNTPLTGVLLTQMINEWKTLSDTYVKQSDYYQVDGRPVVMLSPLNLSSASANSIDYGMVADTLRSVMRSWGYNPYIIGEMTTGWDAPTNHPQEVIRAFDGIVLTNWKTNDYDRAYGFFSYCDLSYQNWKNVLNSWGVDYVPSIFAGYNSPSDTKGYVIARTDSNYVSYCNIAKRSMGKMSIVLINSWNDFINGTQVEPATDYGAQYLRITKQQFKVK